MRKSLCRRLLGGYWTFQLVVFCSLWILPVSGCSGLKIDLSEKGALYLGFGTRVEVGLETSETKSKSSVEIEITKFDEEGN